MGEDLVLKLLDRVSTTVAEAVKPVNDEVKKIMLSVNDLAARVKSLEDARMVKDTQRKMLLAIGGLIVTVATGIWSMVGAEIISEFKYQRELFKRIERKVQ